MLSEYHKRFGIPVSLSEIGVRRSDFDRITAASLKNKHLLYNPTEIHEEDIRNILNSSF
jgi:alcohol dehydrogenase class IV